MGQDFWLQLESSLGKTDEYCLTEFSQGMVRARIQLASGAPRFLCVSVCLALSSSSPSFIFLIYLTSISISVFDLSSPSHSHGWLSG